MVLVLHQQLHYGFVEGGGEEELGRIQTLGEELEEDAEGARSSPQQATGVVVLHELELHKIAKHLSEAGWHELQREDKSYIFRTMFLVLLYLQQVAFIFLHDAVAVE